jgi:hypothetical protein
MAKRGSKKGGFSLKSDMKLGKQHGMAKVGAAKSAAKKA